MSSSTDIQSQIAVHLEQDAHDEALALRKQLIADFPDSVAAAEAWYRIGLDALFRRREVLEAIQAFQKAIGSKHRFWRDAARTSFALLLHRGGQQQKAILELRKVAMTDKPNGHSVTAWAMLGAFYEQAENMAELERCRKLRIEQLKKLSQDRTLETIDRVDFKIQWMMAMIENEQTADARVVWRDFVQEYTEVKNELSETSTQLVDEVRRVLGE